MVLAYAAHHPVGVTMTTLYIAVPCGETQLSVRIDVAGERLNKTHLARVRKYLELTEDELDDLPAGPRTAEKEAEPSGWPLSLSTTPRVAP